MTSACTEDYFSPDALMDPRNLGALQPNRFSASRSFLNKMIREGWEIHRDALELDTRGNGHVRYTVTTRNGSLTFVGWLREPVGHNRTGRIIGTSWDMLGSLIDGVATDDQVAITEREIPKLYEGRAPAGTLIWMRSNQSVRIFQHVRESLSAGRQPDGKAIKRVGYLMRNTGLDGNGTFGTTSFPAIATGHPLKSSYHAQMLAAYLMREVSVDIVEELARLDAPHTAVSLSPEIKRFIGVGNGSALGLVMFVYNRPVLVHSYISTYVEAVKHALSLPLVPGDTRFERLGDLLERAIRYRTFEDTEYRVFTGSKELAADLRRIQAFIRAARRGEIARAKDETLLTAVHRSARGKVSPEAMHTLNALLLELIPEYCDDLLESRLNFDETAELDPATPVSEVRRAIDTQFGWALRMPLNDPEFRDRVWYQSRAAEEPRSGPREEIPGANELIPNYPELVSSLLAALSEHPATQPIGTVIASNPELEQVARTVLTMRGRPYGIPHADPHDIDFVPVWLVRFMNAFVHGLDRTEDFLNRAVLGLIYEGAPFRDELATADPSGWFWNHKSVPGTLTAGSLPQKSQDAPAATPPSPKLSPKESAIRPPHSVSSGYVVMKFREARLVSGRAMQALNVPEGAWQGARDFFITATVADTGAISGFSDILVRLLDETGNAPGWAAPKAKIDNGVLTIDCQNQSLLLSGHVLVNLIGAAATPSGQQVTVNGVTPDGATPGLVLGLARYGVDAGTVEETPDGLVLVATAAEDADRYRSRYRAAFEDFLIEGREVPARLWWGIYYPANAGLYPDTPISRQHTGTVKDVYVPGQKLTKLFAADELNDIADPMLETDLVLSAATPSQATAPRGA